MLLRAILLPRLYLAILFIIVYSVMDLTAQILKVLGSIVYISAVDPGKTNAVHHQIEYH